MRHLTGQLTYTCSDLEEYERIRAKVVEDPDINLVKEDRPGLAITVYFDQFAE